MSDHGQQAQTAHGNLVLLPPKTQVLRPPLPSLRHPTAPANQAASRDVAVQDPMAGTAVSNLHLLG